MLESERPIPSIDDSVFVEGHPGADDGVLVLGKVVGIIDVYERVHVAIELCLSDTEEEERHTSEDTNFRHIDDFPEEPVDNRFKRGEFSSEITELIDDRNGDARNSLIDDSDDDGNGFSQFTGWVVSHAALEPETGEEWWRDPRAGFEYETYEDHAE